MPTELHALPTAPGFPEGVTVWEANLDLDPTEVDRLAQSLDAAERSRAARFHFERDRRRYVVARGLLREVLGLHLGIPPREVSFLIGPHGKPTLGSETLLRFNVSHSEDRGLLAVSTRGREVGVDLESARRLGAARDLPALAARTLSPADSARWWGQPPDVRPDLFLRAWTRLEAYGKATGEGLGNVLGKFSVLPRDTDPPTAWLDVPGWKGWDLPVGEGWSGALVVGSPPG